MQGHQSIHESRVTREYLLGVTQIVSRTAAIQSTVTRSRGQGWYNDPYRYTLTAYPPSVGGAQLLMHRLASELTTRHRVRVVTQWDERRTDWLLGTTVRAPGRPRAYEIDGVEVERLGLSAVTRLGLLPWAAAPHRIAPARCNR